MGFFNWFAPQDTLLFLKETKVSDGYGSKWTKFRPVSDLDTFFTSLLYDESPILIIKSMMNSRIIPMLDCDSTQEYERARKRLADKEMRCAAFQSSPEHYWILPDMSFETFKSAWKATFCIPGSDHKYLKFCNDHGFFTVRGELKNLDEKPELVHIDCVEPNVVKFVDQLVDHFDDDRIRAIADLRYRKKPNKSKKVQAPPLFGYGSCSY